MGNKRYIRSHAAVSWGGAANLLMFTGSFIVAGDIEYKIRAGYS